MPGFLRAGIRKEKCVMSRTKKKWQFPHEFLIVLGLTVLACILTYVIPAGV